MRPKSIHQWRQTECLSTTDNYYLHGMHFTEPESHLQQSDSNDSGKSVMEFPLLYYGVAALWKLFGKHEFIFRLVNILLCMGGLFAFFKLAGSILKDYFWSVAVTLLLFTSPVLVSYTNNFLINSPAFSLMLMAVYSFSEFWLTGRRRYFYVSMFLFLLVGLFKVSSLISFFTIGVIYLTEVSGLIRYKPDRKLFQRPVLQFLAMAAVVGGVFGWYVLMSIYNARHHSLTKSYMGAIQPVWNLSREELSSHFSLTLHFLIYQIYSIPAFIYLLLSGIFLTMHHKKLDLLTKLVLPLLLFGYMCFIALFSQALTVHDYYHIDFLAFAAALSVCLLYFVKTRYPEIYQNPLSKAVFGLFLLFNTLYCENNMSMRYYQTPDAMHAYRRTFASKYELGMWDYQNFAYANGPYERGTPALRAMGIGPEDKIICPDDESPSITLYLLEQKGWTHCMALGDSSLIAEKIAHGAKFMLISDTSYYERKEIRPFLHYPFGKTETIHVFDLRPYTAVKK